MDLIRERPYLLWAAMFGASLLLALLFYFVFPPSQSERYLFFPENITGKLKGESRIVPRHGSLEAQVRALVAEELLGPVRVRDKRLVPVDTRIRSLIVRGDRVYIDFSTEIVTAADQVQETTSRSIQILTHTIQFNFPQIKEVTVTIDGELPGQPYFSIK